MGLVWDTKTVGFPEPPKRRCGAGQMGLELEKGCQPDPERESRTYAGRNQNHRSWCDNVRRQHVVRRKAEPKQHEYLILEKKADSSERQNGQQRARKESQKSRASHKSRE